MVINLTSVEVLAVELPNDAPVEVELETPTYPLIDTVYSVFLPIDLIVPIPEILTLPSLNA